MRLPFPFFTRTLTQTQPGVIGASVSEPPSSDVNGDFLYMYIYIYILSTVRRAEYLLLSNLARVTPHMTV